MKNFEDPVTF